MFDKESLLQSLQQSTHLLLAKIEAIPETIFQKSVSPLNTDCLVN